MDPDVQSLIEDILNNQQNDAPVDAPAPYDSGPSSYGRPDAYLENSPYPPVDVPPPPVSSPAPAFAGVFGSGGYGVGTVGNPMPDNTFGDPSNDWGIQGAREMGPSMQAIANGTYNFGGRLGDLGMGSVLGRMYDLGSQRGMIPRDQSRGEWTKNWIDDAMNNNALRAFPQRNEDGSIDRVIQYENGRNTSERYREAPPKPAAPVSRGGFGGSGGGGGSTGDAQVLYTDIEGHRIVQYKNGGSQVLNPDGSVYQDLRDKSAQNRAMEYFKNRDATRIQEMQASVPWQPTESRGQVPPPQNAKMWGPDEYAPTTSVPAAQVPAGTIRSNQGIREVFDGQEWRPINAEQARQNATPYWQVGPIQYQKPRFG